MHVCTNYVYKRKTVLIGARHMGQGELIADNASTQLTQNRACPQGTSAMPERGATKQTSQHTSDTTAGADAAAAAAAGGAGRLVDEDEAETVASCDADGCSASLSLLSLDCRKASV